MKWKNIMILVLLCSVLASGCQTKNPESEQEPPTSITYHFNSVSDLKRSLASKEILKQQAELPPSKQQSKTFDSFLKKHAANGTLYVPIEKDNKLTLRKKEGYPAIALMSSELFGLPWIWYYFEYQQSDITIKTTSLSELNIEYSDKMSCSEILSLISPTAPNINTYQNYEGYEDVYESKISLDDRSVSCVVFVIKDWKDYVAFVYEDIYVMVSADLEILTEDFWKCISFEK